MTVRRTCKAEHDGNIFKQTSASQSCTERNSNVHGSRSAKETEDSFQRSPQMKWLQNKHEVLCFSPQRPAWMERLSGSEDGASPGLLVGQR